MGKGDIKTRRGKIFNGSYGKKRPKKIADATVIAPKVEKKAEPKKETKKKK